MARRGSSAQALDPSGASPDMCRTRDVEKVQDCTFSTTCSSRQVDQTILERTDMHLRYIELFHAVLTTGSLTGAAKLLNISQPAASKALQHAEDQLGFPLFSRVRGRLQPTQQALLLRR